MSRQFLLLLFLNSFFAVSSHAQISISLAPTEAFLSGTPGTTVSQEFTVINDGPQPFLLACRFGDVWYKGEDTVSADLGTFKEGQAGFYLQCSPNRKLVPPKFAQRIKVVGLVPKEQKGATYARLYTQTLPAEQATGTDGKAKSASIGYSAQVGALIGLIANGTQKYGIDVIDVKVESSKKFSTLRFKVKNTGNVHFSGNGNVVLTDSQNKVLEKVDIKVPFTYPGQSKSVSANLSDPLAVGNFKGLLSITGTSVDTALVKEFVISNKPK